MKLWIRNSMNKLYIFWPHRTSSSYVSRRTKVSIDVQNAYLLVMSPSRAGSSSSWRISARLGSWPFHFSSKSKIGQKRAKIQFSVEDLLLIIFYDKLVLKMTKLCNENFVLISLHKWSWNWLESCYSSKIRKFDVHIVSIVSSVSAQKLSAPARLGS